MKKKAGFTLVEVLASIAIVALLFGIGVPTYQVITKNVKQGNYENKVSRIETSAAKYGAETANTLVFVNTLIEEGYLEADDESGNYKDPRDNTLLNCNLVSIYYDEGQFYGKMSEEKAVLADGKTCDIEKITQQSAYLDLSLYEVENENSTLEQKLALNTWTRKNVMIVAEVPEEVRNDVVKITFSGAGSKEERIVNGDFNNQNKFYIHASQILNTTYTAVIEVKQTSEDGSEKVGVYTSGIKVMIDLQNPIVYKNEIKVDCADEWTNTPKDVSILSSDQSGSGVYGYYFMDHNAACSTTKSDYQPLSENDNHSSGYFIASLLKGTYYACVMDNVGNVSDAVDFSIYKTDQNVPSIDNFTKNGTTYANTEFYRDLRIDTHVSDSASYDESGIRNVQYCISYNGNQCEPHNTLEIQNGVSSYQMIDNDNKQLICAKVTDNAGNISDTKCFGTFWVKKAINIGDACKMCDASNNYCNQGIYVRYGSYTFVLYKDLSNSCFGYTSVGSMPLIDTFCCDQGICHSGYVYSESVGIYKSLKAKYNTLPNSRIYNLNMVGYPFGSVHSSSFNNVSNTAVSTRHEIREYSLSKFPSIVNQGYSYGLPSEYFSDTTCFIDNVQYNRIHGDDFVVGKTYTVTCKRQVGTKEEEVPATEDEEDSEVHYITVPNIVWEESKSFKIAKNPDFNMTGAGSATGTGISASGYIFYAATPYYHSASYGLLDILDYQAIRGKSYAHGLSTLLSTVIDAVVYSPSTSGSWNQAFGHDGRNSDISAIYVTSGNLQAITPMQFGARPTVMSVPFKKSVSIRRGNGSSSDPFIIE